MIETLNEKSEKIQLSKFLVDLLKPIVELEIKKSELINEMIPKYYKKKTKS